MVKIEICKLIDYLSADGAKVIGFDIGFLEPDENSSLQVINKIESKLKSAGSSNTDVSQYLNDMKKDADNDLALADSIKKSSATVVLGYFFHTSQPGSELPVITRRDRKPIEANRTLEVSIDYIRGSGTG